MFTTFYHNFGKRLLDITLVSLTLILFLPILPLLALLVRLKLGTPILFRQQRPGRYGQPFTILKFRTMTDARDALGNLQPFFHRRVRQCLPIHLAVRAQRQLVQNHQPCRHHVVR